MRQTVVEGLGVSRGERQPGARHCKQAGLPEEPARDEDRGAGATARCCHVPGAKPIPLLSHWPLITSAARWRWLQPALACQLL